MVDLPALAEALRGGLIGSAAFDDAPHGDAMASLVGLPNVIFTRELCSICASLSPNQAAMLTHTIIAVQHTSAIGQLRQCLPVLSML